MIARWIVLVYLSVMIAMGPTAPANTPLILSSPELDTTAWPYYPLTYEWKVTAQWTGVSGGTLGCFHRRNNTFDTLMRCVPITYAGWRTTVLPSDLGLRKQGTVIHGGDTIVLVLYDNDRTELGRTETVVPGTTIMIPVIIVGGQSNGQTVGDTS